MTLSIIIVSFNTKKLTLSCIASIRKYHPKVPYEIIVVDNGSSDGSVKAIEELKLKTDNLKLIGNKENLGFAKANNQGISESKGDYILLLNSDTQVKKDSIDNLLDYAKSDEAIGVIAPRLLNSDGSLQGSVFRLPTVFRAIREYFFGEKGLLSKYAPSGNNPVVVESTTMAAFLITPSARKKVGTLNEKYFMYFEDIDYCRRVKNAGLKTVYLPKSEVIHYHGSSGKKLAGNDDQWKRLIPSSKIYHGILNHYVFTVILWFGQKFPKLARFSFIATILLIIATPTLLPLFKKGFFPTHDYIYIARIQQLDSVLKTGNFPVRWAPDIRYGEPLFNFYAPLPYYLGSGIHSLGFSYLNTTKLLLGLSFVLSAISMFFLAKRLFGNWPGLVSSVLYLYAPYRSVDVYVRGALSESWAFVFLPLTFLFSYNLFREKNLRNLAALALSLAALFYTHNVMVLMFLPFFLGWVTLLVIKPMKSKVKVITLLLLAISLGVGLGASYLFPAYFEKELVQTEHLTAGYFDFRAHFVSITQLVKPFWGYGASLWGMEDKLPFQVGLVHWAVIVIGFTISVLRFKKLSLAQNLLIVFLLSSFVFSLFMMHNKSTPIWERISELRFIQFPWRFLGISIFFVSLFGGLSLSIVRPKVDIKIPAIILVCIIIIANVGYFKPESYYFDSIDEHYISKENILWKNDKVPKDYLPIWTKRLLTERLNMPRVVEGKAQVSDYEMRGVMVKFETSVETEAKIEVPVSYFPGWQAKVNGQAQKLEKPSEFGLIVLTLSKGNNLVELRFGDTPVRSISNKISFLSLLVLVIIFIKAFKKTPDFK